MHASNLVVLRGTVSSEPRLIELPSGSVVTQLQITTRRDEVAETVPVAVFDRAVDVTTGDELVLAGHVRRRFFRVGGSTQSRTEVVATDIASATRSRSVARLLRHAVATLDGG